MFRSLRFEKRQVNPKRHRHLRSHETTLTETQAPSRSLKTSWAYEPPSCGLDSRMAISPPIRSNGRSIPKDARNPKDFSEDHGFDATLWPPPFAAGALLTHKHRGRNAPDFTSAWGAKSSAKSKPSAHTPAATAF